MTSKTSRRDQLITLVAPVVAAAGYDLEEITVSPAGSRQLVRVVVDRDRGVSLDEAAEVSRAVSAVLDEHDGVLGQSPYVLEVSSPGVDRPLTEPRHWRRAAGRRVRVQVAGEGAIDGRVVSADEAGVVIDIVGAPGKSDGAGQSDKSASGGAGHPRKSARGGAGKSTEAGETGRSGTAGQRRVYPYPALGRGQVQVEFSVEFSVQVGRGDREEELS